MTSDMLFAFAIDASDSTTLRTDVASDWEDAASPCSVSEASNCVTGGVCVSVIVVPFTDSSYASVTVVVGSTQSLPSVRYEAHAKSMVQVSTAEYGTHSSTCVSLDIKNDGSDS